MAHIGNDITIVSGLPRCGTSLMMQMIDAGGLRALTDEVCARGIQVETPPLRDDAEHTVYWRLRVDEPSAGSLRWHVGPGVAEKTIVSTADPGRLLTVSVHRPGPGFWDRLLRPGEPGFDADGPVEAIDLYYPRRSTPFFGVDIPWWATFLIASMIAALCVRPFLKVQF